MRDEIEFQIRENGDGLELLLPEKKVNLSDQNWDYYKMYLVALNLVLSFLKNNALNAGDFVEIWASPSITEENANDKSWFLLPDLNDQCIRLWKIADGCLEMFDDEGEIELLFGLFNNLVLKKVDGTAESFWQAQREELNSWPEEDWKMVLTTPCGQVLGVIIDIESDFLTIKETESGELRCYAYEDLEGYEVFKL